MDALQKLLFRRAAVRGETVSLHEEFDRAVEHQHLPVAVRRLAGEVTASALLAAAALGTLSLVEHRMIRQTEDLRAQAAQIEYENSLLKQYTDELGSAKSVERIAREELGMVSPDTVLIEAQVK